MAQSLMGEGKAAKAEPSLRQLHKTEMRVFGAEHRSTLATAANLAQSLSHQGKYADAERINREVLGVLKRVLGAEHPETLMGANNLASCLARQGKYAEAEAIQRDLHKMEMRVLGAEHADTRRVGTIWPSPSVAKANMQKLRLYYANCLELPSVCSGRSIPRR